MVEARTALTPPNLTEFTEKAWKSFSDEYDHYRHKGGRVEPFQLINMQVWNVIVILIPEIDEKMGVIDLFKAVESRGATDRLADPTRSLHGLRLGALLEMAFSLGLIPSTSVRMTRDDLRTLIREKFPTQPAKKSSPTVRQWMVEQFKTAPCMLKMPLLTGEVLCCTTVQHSNVFSQLLRSRIVPKHFPEFYREEPFELRMHYDLSEGKLRTITGRKPADDDLKTKLDAFYSNRFKSALDHEEKYDLRNLGYNIPYLAT